jgi:hypothetical protein
LSFRLPGWLGSFACKSLPMEQETINLYDALRWMEAQKTPFRVEFIKTSLTQRTGGEVRVIDKALCGALKNSSFSEHMVAFRDMNAPDASPVHTYIYSLCFVNGKTITV